MERFLQERIRIAMCLAWINIGYIRGILGVHLDTQVDRPQNGIGREDYY